jgi:hypothetical protein
MIINLTESKMFTEHPDGRFAKYYGVQEGLWTEMWRRYRILEYEIKDLQDFFYVKTAKEINERMITKWIWRTQIYMRANEAMRHGARAVSSEWFGALEHDLLVQLLKNVKSGKSKDVRAVV